jgi:hypothetical protein
VPSFPDTGARFAPPTVRQSRPAAAAAG